ncbi:MAG: BrxA/BrxB family bacilliredoxin [Flavobacteriales bacterium]
MYPAEIVLPLKQDLTSAGFADLSTAEDVDNVINSGKEETVLVVINSVCGCAARNARPAAKQAVQTTGKKPSKITTVFAGFDTDAVARARQYMLPYPPSSPSIALFKNGRLVHMIERHAIEGRPAELIADNLVAAFEEYC